MMVVTLIVVSVVIAEGKRPVSFRTRKLSPPAPMVLHSGGCGRVGRRRTQRDRKPILGPQDGLSAFPRAGIPGPFFHFWALFTGPSFEFLWLAGHAGPDVAVGALRGGLVAGAPLRHRDDAGLDQVQTVEEPGHLGLGAEAEVDVVGAVGR